MLQQRRIQRWRLLVPDIEPGAGQMARLQGCVQRCFVMDAAACGGHEVRAALHPGKCCGIDHAACRGITRTVQGHKVAVLKEFIQACRLRTPMANLFCAQQGIMRQHTHAEGACQRGHPPPRVTNADHAQRLAGQLAPGQVFARKPAFTTQQTITLGDAMRQTDDQAQCVLGHRHRIAARLVHHRHPGSGAGRHIDRVEARTGRRCTQQLRASLQELMRHESSSRQLVFRRGHVIGMGTLQAAHGIGQGGRHGLYQQLHIGGSGHPLIEDRMGPMFEAHDARARQAHQSGPCVGQSDHDVNQFRFHIPRRTALGRSLRR